MTIKTNDYDLDGIDELSRFISNNVFLHDDWNYEIGEADWDQYDTNPLLLGPDGCIVSTLDGFGNDYLQYFDDLIGLPKAIIEPKRKWMQLTQNLLYDDFSINSLKNLVQDNRLGLSVFYSESSQELDKLVKRISTPSYTPEVVPSTDDFISLNSKIGIVDLAERLEIRIPEYELCSNKIDIVTFFRRAQRKGYKSIILKQGHRNKYSIHSEDEITNLDITLQYPILAEYMYEVCSSPVIQVFVSDRNVFHLFTLDQHIKDLHFIGDKYPSSLSTELKFEGIEVTKSIANFFPNFRGVLGIDFIVTKNNQLLMVDINPRFNSSTYPMYFALRHAIDLGQSETFCANYKIIDNCPIANLSVLLKNDFPILRRNTLDGVLVYNPVYDFKRNNVRKWSYLVIASDEDKYYKLTSQFKNFIEQQKY